MTTRSPLTRVSGQGPVLVVLGLLMAVGIALRVPGWSNGGLFYDDAWFAFPAKVGLGTALHLSVTTPGYSVVQRSWILLDPGSTRWAIALPLALGIIAPGAIFLLGRTFKLRAGVSLILAALVAISPVAIEYSVRVKEYEADLVLAALVLLLAELVRRDRSTHRIALLAVVSLLVVVTSVSLLIVVLGAWLGLLLIALSDRQRRGAIGLGALSSTLVVLAAGLVTHRHAPPALTSFWVTTNNLNGPPHTISKLLQVIGAIAVGLPHGLLGTPSLPTGLLLDLAAPQLDQALVIAAIELAIVVAISVRPVRALLHHSGSEEARLVLPLATVGTAIVLSLLGFVPLGAGRTDLVIYPSLLVLIGAVLSWLVERLRTLTANVTRSSTSRVVAVLGALGVGIAGVALGWSHRSWYPAQDLRQLSARIHVAARPHDVLVISHRNSFTWAYDDLSPWQLHRSKNARAAGAVGFWVTFRDPTVLAEVVNSTPTVPSSSIGTPVPGLLPSMHRLWLVGTTYATASPSTQHLRSAVARIPMPSPANAQLQAGGWVPKGPVLLEHGVYAQLMVRH